MAHIALSSSAASGRAVVAPPSVSSHIPFTSLGARTTRAPILLRSLSCEAFRFP
jgi:hypothetical protein